MAGSFEKMRNSKDFPTPIWYNSDYRKVESELNPNDDSNDDEDMEQEEKASEDFEDDTSECSIETDTDRWVKGFRVIKFDSSFINILSVFLPGL